MDPQSLSAFLEILGMTEVPMGMFYTDGRPSDCYAPGAGELPSVEKEARDEVDWKSLWENFSCIVGHIWLARKKKKPACFDRDHFGCLGGAFFLGYLKPQLEFIVHYVSTGIPNVIEGERYLADPEVTRRFYETIDPRPAPKRYCVFKEVSAFGPGEEPELVIFFGRPEVISGLHQLATFVTGDFEAVRSPFGSGCGNMVTWPLKYLAEGKLNAVLGCWDPSDRPFLKTDEISLTVPYPMFRMMLDRWQESFLTTNTWKNSRKKIERSRKAWGEESQ